MILLKILYAWTVLIETTLCFSPGFVVGMAKLQNQKAKALATAINWKVKNDYKRALAKSKKHMSLLGENLERFTRHLDNQSLNRFPNIPSTRTLNSGQDKFQPFARYDEDEYESEFDQGENGYDDNDDGYYDDAYERQAAAESYDQSIPLFEQTFPFYHHRGHVFNRGSFFNQRDASSIDEPTVGITSNNKESENSKNPDDQINNLVDNDDKTSSFHYLPFTPYALEYQPSYQNPAYFNPAQPENKKEMVKFLEGQKIYWDKLWPKTLVHGNKFHYNKPRGIPYHYEDVKVQPQVMYSPGEEENDQPIVNYLNVPNEEKIVENDQKYETPSEGYLYPEEKPPIPTVYHVEIAPPSPPKPPKPQLIKPPKPPVQLPKPKPEGKLMKGLKLDKQIINSEISMLHEKGELFFDMLRPLLTHLDSNVLHSLKPISHVMHPIEAPEKQPNAYTYPREAVEDDIQVVEPYLPEAPEKDTKVPNSFIHKIPEVNDIPSSNLREAPEQHIDIEEGSLGEPLKAPDNHFEFISNTVVEPYLHEAPEKDIQVPNLFIHEIPEVNYIPSSNLRVAPEQNINIEEGSLGEPLKAPDNHFEFIPNTAATDNPVVGSLLQIPPNFYSLKKFKRSLTTSDEDYVNTLITEGAKLLLILQKLAETHHEITKKNDDISKNRKKRSRSLKELLEDPTTEIDFSKTIESVGTLAKTILNHENAPIFHVRNLVGSAKDTVMSTMRIPNQHFITPSGYDIVNNPDKDEVLGTPDLSSRFGEDGETNAFWPAGMVTSTFQQIGQVVRNAVKSSQETINHVGEIATHAKKAIQSAQTTPDIVMLTLPPLPVVSGDKVRMKSRFGGDDDDEVKVPEPKPKFVNMGNMLDAVGVSDPTKEVPRIADDPYLNKILIKVNGLKETLGVNDIQDFVHETKKKLTDLKRSNLLNIKIPCATKRFKRDTNGYAGDDDVVGISFIPQSLWHPFLGTDFARHNVDEDILGNAKNTPKHTDSLVGVSFIPGSLRHPFLGPDLLQQNFDTERRTLLPDGSVNENILGFALEETQYNKEFPGYGNYLHSNSDVVLMAPNYANDQRYAQMFTEFPENSDNGVDKRERTTLMKVTGKMLLPFMGLADNEKKKMFHEQYLPSQGGNDDMGDYYGYSDDLYYK